jgi:hypothetical protein
MVCLAVRIESSWIVLAGVFLSNRPLKLKGMNCSESFCLVFFHHHSILPLKKVNECGNLRNNFYSKRSELVKDKLMKLAGCKSELSEQRQHNGRYVWP